MPRGCRAGRLVTLIATVLVVPLGYVVHKVIHWLGEDLTVMLLGALAYAMTAASVALARHLLGYGDRRDREDASLRG